MGPSCQRAGHTDTDDGWEDDAGVFMVARAARRSERFLR